MYSDLINQTVESDFSCKSMGAFFDSSNETYSKILAAVQQVTLQFEDVQDVDAYISEVLSSYDLNGSELVKLNRGVTDVQTIVRNTYLQVEKFALEFQDGSDPLNEAIISVKNMVGEELQDVKYSVNDIIEEIKATYQASVATAASLWASAGATVSDRMQIFQTKFQAYFDQTSLEGSNVARMLRDKLLEVDFVPDNFVSWLSSALNIEGRSVTDNPTDESDFLKFTGASPVGTLDFSFATKALVTTGKVIAGAVASVFNLVKSGVQWVAKKVYNVAVNPVDIEVVNNLGAHTIDGWSIEDSTTNYLTLSRSTSGFIGTLAGIWFKFDTIFGEILIRIDSVELDNQEADRYAIHATSKIRLKPVNPAAIGWSDDIQGYNYFNYDAAAKRLSWNLNSVTPNMVMAAVSNIRNYGDWRPFVNDSNESFMHFCYVCSAHMLFIYMWSMAWIVENRGDEPWNPNLFFTSGAVQMKDTVTNADFVQVASGWNKSTSAPAFGWNNIITGFTSNTPSPLSLCHTIIVMLVKQQLAKLEDPLNYPYIPYVKDVEGFSNPTYRVKTDDENSKAFSTFLTVVVTVVIVAAVAISASVIASKLAKKAFWKRTSFVSQCDSKLWAGETLTKQEKKKYVKYSRKLNASTMLTKGLKASDVESIPDMSYVNPDTQNIVGLISGM